MIRYIPNALTIFRILLTPVFLAVAIFGTSTTAQVWVLVIFVTAALTDWLDGLIARRCNIITNFGKIFDPLADKFIVLSAIGILVWKSPFQLSWLIFAIIAVREITVTILRDVYLRRNIVIPADRWGKIKTTMQMSGIIICLSCWVLDFTSNTVIGASHIWFWLVAAITVMSGVNYIMIKRVA